MNPFIGEIAALLTSLFFSLTAVIFSIASRQIGSVMLNRIRLVFAILLLILAHLVLSIPLPFDASLDRWFWFGLSGIIGLALGDTFLFQSYRYISPRLTMLLMALAPILAAVVAWAFMGEQLSFYQVIGILITLAGIAWVIAEKNGQTDHSHPVKRRDFWLGVLCGLGAATGQALGLITAKMGAGGGFPALSGTLIRMIGAGALIWLFAIFTGQAGATVRLALERRQVLWLVILGALVGPTLGVTFSLVAIQNTEIGIASTLMALPPVILLPISYFFFKERFGWQAVAGTLLAMVGVSILFLV